MAWYIQYNGIYVLVKVKIGPSRSLDHIFLCDLDMFKLNHVSSIHNQLTGEDVTRCRWIDPSMFGDPHMLNSPTTFYDKSCCAQERLMYSILDPI
jgi:hypothetical protein